MSQREVGARAGIVARSVSGPWPFVRREDSEASVSASSSCLIIASAAASLPAVNVAGVGSFEVFSEDFESLAFQKVEISHSRCSNVVIYFHGLFLENI